MYYSTLLRLGVPFSSVPYGRLAEDPVSALQRMCEICELDYFPGKEKFWEQTSHHAFGSRGTRLQVRGEKDEGFQNIGVYPEDFELKFASQYSEGKADPRIALLADELERRSIFSSDYPVDVSFRRPLLMPHWYYAIKARRKIQRHFPSQWAYDQ